MLTQEDFEKHSDRDAFMEVLQSKIPEANLKDILHTVRYEKELIRLQAELVDLQQWVAKHKKRVCILFEGRDAAGNGPAQEILGRRATDHGDPCRTQHWRRRAWPSAQHGWDRRPPLPVHSRLRPQPRGPRWLDPAHRLLG